MSRPDYFPNCMTLSSKMEPCLGYSETRTKLDLEEKENARLRKALGIFLGADERFQVAVGGNPIAVDKMLTEARSLLDGNKPKPGTFDPRDAGFTLEDCEWPQEAIDQIMIDPKEDPLKDDVE